MTKQEIFNTVARHLLTQGEKSMVGDKCQYRGDRGLKCAVGVLIRDEYYDPEFDEGEGISVHWAYRCLPKQEKLYRAIEKALSRKLYREDFELLVALQELHDGNDPSTWRMELGALAEAHALSAEVLQ